MRQKVQDALLLLKSERKYQFIAVVVMIFIAVSVLSPGGGPRRAGGQSKPQPVTAGRGETDEAYRDLVTRFNENLTDLGRKMDDNERRDSERDKNIQDLEQRSADIFRKILEQMAQQGEGRGGNGGPVAGIGTDDLSAPAPYDIGPGDLSADGLGSGTGGGGQMASADLDSFGDVADAPVAPPPPPPPAKVAYVSAGDSVRIKLLAGVNAPTDGTPYPVVFQLDGNVAGPDGSALPLGEARLIAAAQGSLTDSRALFRLSDLSIRLPDGRRKVLKVDGWVVGEDGVRGMPGILIDPIGKTVGASILTGAIDGFGQGVADAESSIQRNGFEEQIIVSGNVGKYAAGKALSGAGDTWSSIVRDRAKELVPHVQVLSGRTATAVFSKSFAVDGLMEALEATQGSPGSVD